jgi:DNA-binding Lrp family transcriptional regulator
LNRQCRVFDGASELQRSDHARRGAQGRQERDSIGRKYQINASTVRYRIRSLENRGLMRFITVLDPQALGIQIFAFVEIEPEANRLADIVARLRESACFLEF